MPPRDKKEQETAFVLDPDAVFAEVPVHFPNFPGVYFPGEPIAASEILVRLNGVDTVDELKDHVASEGFPLKVKMVDEGSAPMPRPATQIPSEEEVKAGVVEAPDAPLPSAEVIPAGTLSADVAAAESAPMAKETAPAEEEWKT